MIYGLMLRVSFMMLVAAVQVDSEIPDNSELSVGVSKEFRRVDYFENRMTILGLAEDNNFCTQLMALDLSRDDRFKPVTQIDRRRIRTADLGAVVAAPDGAAVYCMAGGVLLCLDRTGAVTARLKIEDFDLKNSEYEFAGPAFAFRDAVCIGISRLVAEKSNERQVYIEEFIAKIDVGRVAAAPLLGPLSKDGAAIDMEGGNAYIVGPRPRIFDLATGHATKANWGRYNVAQWSRGRGLLLSGNVDGQIAVWDPMSDTARVVGKGHFAAWACDNTIIYCIGSTQLWRCDDDGGNARPIYVSSPMTQGTERFLPMALRPRVSQDGRYVAFVYRVPDGNAIVESGTVVLDLSTLKYRVLESVEIQNSILLESE